MLKSAKKNNSPTIKTSKTLSAGDTLHQLAFDHSSQANIVFTVSNRKAILVNKAACRLLGYSQNELIAKNIETIFTGNKKNQNKIKRDLLQESFTISLTVITKNGNHIPCQVTHSTFSDEHGFKKGILNITDMSENILKENNIDKKNRKLVTETIALTKSNQKKIDTKKEKIVADNIVLAKSKQKKIDSKKEKIVAENIVLAKSKQKKIDTKKEKIVAENIVLAKSKQKKIDTKKEKIVAENIVLAKSKQKKIDSKKEKVVSQNIIQALAKSDGEKLDYENNGRNKLLIEIEENLRMMFNSSTDVLFDSDLLADKLMTNVAYEKEFGYTKMKKSLSSVDWAIHIHPDDKERVMQDYSRMLHSADTEWKCAYRFLRADDSVANVLTNRIILRDADGKAYRMIGSMQDISKQRALEERLEEEIKLKEKQIADASEDAKDTERSDIGKELHDNVNQLLGVSKLYLDMAKAGGENSELYLSKSSEYTLSAIEEIRKLTKSLTTDVIRDIGLCSAIESIALETMEVSPVKIALGVESFIEKSVTDKFKLNILRIIQEQLNNILKHSSATKVSINLLQTKKTIKLTISDNGIGFDIRKKRKGIGLINIKSRAAAYNGIADFISAPGKGCILTATFSVMDNTLKQAS